jgi:hypothetical protein
MQNLKLTTGNAKPKSPLAGLLLSVVTFRLDVAGFALSVVSFALTWSVVRFSLGWGSA